MAEGMFKSLLCVFVATAFSMAEVARGHLMPCYFVFGDSVFDNGNNNVLKTSAKVNYLPYGIGFPGGPTGRFSDGRNIPDFIAELMLFRDYIPPFTGASPEQAHTGLNYASGGGGILEESSKHLGDRISFERQIKIHREMIKTANVSSEKLKKCLYTIHIGSNDYLNNYFMPAPYTTNGNFTYDQYADFLSQRYHSYLKSLYDLGARKVAVFGVSKLGCTPRMIASHGDGKGCAAEVNNAVEPFNKNLRALVKEFNENAGNAKFTFVNLFLAQNLVSPLGVILVTDKSCCTVEPGQELCAANKPLRNLRTQYVYWDNVHSTEAANMVVAKAAFLGAIASPYPINLLPLL